MANKRADTQIGNKISESATQMPPEAGDSNSDDRLNRIATAAFLRAAARNFNGGNPVEDWLQAEIEVDSALKGR